MTQHSAKAPAHSATNDRLISLIRTFFFNIPLQSAVNHLGESLSEYVGQSVEDDEAALPASAIREACTISGQITNFLIALNEEIEAINFDNVDTNHTSGVSSDMTLVGEMNPVRKRATEEDMKH